MPFSSHEDSELLSSRRQRFLLYDMILYVICGMVFVPIFSFMGIVPESIP